MNNRFKFRWYSKIYNEMCDVNCIEPNNEFVNFQQGKFNDISTRINLGNGVLMQCTGLKDKNGKLIYEGDIVKINTHYNHLVCDDYEYDCESEKGYSLFKIIYDDDMARFGAERIKCVKWETHHYSLNYVPHNHKVIGNIYENKELLESEG